ncbi:MAG: hypothetical protein AAFX93_01195 [Verrucomicrobiota bacterium]
MTNARFKQLVNLYLDREISPRDLECLRRELSDPQRKKEFQDLRCVHEAEKKALSLLCGDDVNQSAKRCSISERAAHAFNEARLRFEERRKGMVLMAQFSAATIAIAFTVGFLYRDSVESLEVEAGPEADLAQSQNLELRRQLEAQLNVPISSARLLRDEAGRTIALVSLENRGEVYVQPVQVVSESNLLSLGDALDSINPGMPEPSSLLDRREVQIPFRQIPGSTAPIVLVEETSFGSMVTIEFAY